MLSYLRIGVARASRKFPLLLEMIADGRLHLSGAAKLAPHLTPANHESVLARAAHRSKRRIEELVAELSPRPDVPAVIRRLSEGGGIPTADAVKFEIPAAPSPPAPSAPPPPPVVQVLAPARHKVQIHGIGRASREAGAVVGSHERRPGGSDRSGGDGKTGTARSPSLRRGEDPTQEPERDRYYAQVDFGKDVFRPYRGGGGGQVSETALADEVVWRNGSSGIGPRA